MLRDYFDRKMKEKLEAGGFFILNKKRGVTSFDEVFVLRRDLGIKKVGHSGTLDSNTIGVLVCGVGRATKYLQYLLLSGKVYEAEILFHSKVERIDFERVLKSFRGKIRQLPPQKSSVKRKEREREIYDLEILEFYKSGRGARFIASVERGTYIRKLCHDMGEVMGVRSQMGELRRTKAGVFSEKDRTMSSKGLRILFGKFRKAGFLKLYYFFKINRYFYSVAELFEREENMKEVFVKKEAVKYIRNGAVLRGFNFKKNQKAFLGERVSIWYGKIFLGVGEFLENFDTNDLSKDDIENEIMKMKKVFY